MSCDSCHATAVWLSLMHMPVHHMRCVYLWALVQLLYKRNLFYVMELGFNSDPSHMIIERWVCYSSASTAYELTSRS